MHAYWAESHTFTESSGGIKNENNAAGMEFEQYYIHSGGKSKSAGVSFDAKRFASCYSPTQQALLQCEKVHNVRHMAQLEASRSQLI